MVNYPILSLEAQLKIINDQIMHIKPYAKIDLYREILKPEDDNGEGKSDD